MRIQSRIRIRIHTSEAWIRIREAKKHVDPVDPDPDADPEHCLKVTEEKTRIWSWIRDTDPQIWIRTKMSQIPNTDFPLALFL